METYEVQKSYAQWLGQADADLKNNCIIQLEISRTIRDIILFTAGWQSGYAAACKAAYAVRFSCQPPMDD